MSAQPRIGTIIQFDYIPDCSLSFFSHHVSPYNASVAIKNLITSSAAAEGAGEYKVLRWKIAYLTQKSQRPFTYQI